MLSCPKIWYVLWCDTQIPCFFNFFLCSLNDQCVIWCAFLELCFLKAKKETKTKSTKNHSLIISFEELKIFFRFFFFFFFLIGNSFFHSTETIVNIIVLPVIWKSAGFRQLSFIESFFIFLTECVNSIGACLGSYTRLQFILQTALQMDFPRNT